MIGSNSDFLYNFLCYFGLSQVFLNAGKTFDPCPTGRVVGSGRVGLGFSGVGSVTRDHVYVRQVSPFKFYCVGFFKYIYLLYIYI
jgi:hypothetical protein